MAIIDAHATADGRAVHCDIDGCTVVLVPGDRSTPPGPWTIDDAIIAAQDTGWLIDIFTPGTDKCPDHARAAIDPNRWPSGVAAQCEKCGRVTIVRGFGDDMLGEPTEYLCKPCWTGTDDEDES